MPGKSKSEAKDNFCEFFKKSLSWLTDAFLHPIQVSDNRFLLTYEPFPDLLCDIGSRTLSISQLFTTCVDKIAIEPAHSGSRIDSASSMRPCIFLEKIEMSSRRDMPGEKRFCRRSSVLI